MPAETSLDITQLLSHWNSGDEGARQQLMTLLYDDLRAIAARALRNEKQQPNLQPTLLVNEAYLKLSETNRITWADRGHFLAVAARIMREVLVDEARKRGARKRDWGRRVTFSINLLGTGDPLVDLLELDEAMGQLEEIRPDLARVVELRFFCDLTIDEAAAALDCSAATVNRQWRTARAWLAQALSDPGA